MRLDTEKSKFDGLNVVDKKNIIGTPECSQEHTRVNAHDMIGKCELSFAAECSRLCSGKSRIPGVKSGSKKQLKREENTKMKHRFYHLQLKNDIHIIPGKNC